MRAFNQDIFALARANNFFRREILTNEHTQAASDHGRGPGGAMRPDTHAFEPWTPRALAVLRIVTGFLYVQHGTAILLGMPHLAMFDHLQAVSLVGIGGVLELVGGALVLVGLFTRPAAFILSGEMAVAYFMSHASRDNFLSPMLNQGEPAVLFCFIFLFIAAAGAGPLSIDAIWPRNKPHPSGGTGELRQQGRRGAGEADRRVREGHADDANCCGAAT